MTSLKDLRVGDKIRYTDPPLWGNTVRYGTKLGDNGTVILGHKANDENIANILDNNSPRRGWAWELVKAAPVEDPRTKAELLRRIDDLLDSNNEYLERYRESMRAGDRLERMAALTVEKLMAAEAERDAAVARLNAIETALKGVQS